MAKPITDWILSHLIWLIYTVWSCTWRIKIVESPEYQALRVQNKNQVFAIWHGDELAMMRFARYYSVATMASLSKDGELMNKILHLFGFMTSRGSSSRGGAQGLRGLLRIVKEHRRTPLLTVDGPKGPIYQPKPGILHISRLTKSPIIPGAVAATHALHFKKSWNKAYIPLPFSKVVLYWGVPFEQAIHDDENSSEEILCEQLKLSLFSAHSEACKLLV